MAEKNAIEIEPLAFADFFNQLFIKTDKVRIIKTPEASNYLIQAADRLQQNLIITESDEVCLELDYVLACYNEDLDAIVLYPR